MKKALFILADPNLVSFLHKAVLPTIKLAYAKGGIKTEIININIDGFNPISKGNLISDSFLKAYKHAIKTSDHIHILSPTQMGGFSPALEGFFDQILIDEYISKGNRINRTVFFHIFHSKRKINPLNLAYIRLKWMISPKVFGKTYVEQYTTSVLDKDARVKKLQRIKDKISKLIC